MNFSAFHTIGIYEAGLSPTLPLSYTCRCEKTSPSLSYTSFVDGSLWRQSKTDKGACNTDKGFTGCVSAGPGFSLILEDVPEGGM